MEQKRCRKAITLMFLSILIALAFSNFLPQHTAKADVVTIATTELLNPYYMSTSEITIFVSQLVGQNISLFITRLNTMYEWDETTSPGITKTKQIISIANSHGIEVVVDLHTWHTTWSSYFDSTASGYVANRAQYITHVTNVLNAFDDTNVHSFHVLNEPAAQTANSGENQFILDIITAANSATDKPISVRFMGAYSATTGHYSSSINNAVDYLCRNTYWTGGSYWDPDDGGYGQTLMNNDLAAAQALGKELWITEFGKRYTEGEESQRDYVERYVDWANGMELNVISCWASQPDSGGEDFNIFNGYTPRPAFYELVNEEELPESEGQWLISYEWWTISSEWIIAGESGSTIYTRTSSITLSFIIELLTQATTSASSVATDAPLNSIRRAAQRKTLYANNRFWVFYSDGTNLVFNSSANGYAWSAGTTVRACNDGEKFSIFGANNYIYYAFTNEASGGTILFRRGLANSDGTITWDSEQTAKAGEGGVTFWMPKLCVDSNGYPWIAYSNDNYPYVTKSSTNDGTWSTASGFPYQLNSTSDANWKCTIVPLASLKAYAVYCIDDESPRGKLWDGDSWGSEESVVGLNAAQDSTVSYGDDVYYGFSETTSGDLHFVKRTYGVGWGSAETIQSGASAYITITVHRGQIYAFWIGSPVANHIYYKIRSLAGTWDASPTDWVTEATTVQTTRLTSFFTSANGYIGLIYLTGTSPYTIRFAFIDLESSYYTTFRSIALTLILSFLKNVPTQWIPIPFGWPDFANLLSGFVTAQFIYPVMILGMVVVGLVVLYYGRDQFSAYDYVRSAPWLLVLAAIGIVAVFVYYIITSAILGAF